VFTAGRIVALVVVVEVGVLLAWVLLSQRWDTAAYF
jgi:hypothetical protein